MVKKIIAVSDIHIRNLRRNDEYQEKLQTFIDKCKEIASEYDSSEVRIVIAGDILHNKTDISPEAYLMCSWLLKKLGEIATTIVIAGNHDISKNEQRLDPITSIFSMSNFENVYYLDKELEYVSGCLEDDNIIWCLYSSFDGFARPEIDEYRIQSPDSTYVGLFHGDLKGSKTDVGYQSENGFSPSYFDGLDFCIMGHIHRRQCEKYEGIPLVYCGSLIQQDFGENLSKHGFVVWDVESETYEEVDFTDEKYGFYNFTINSEDDIKEDREELINL
jgi:DNA repair exonuclease SbcCD nuclease subunit